MKKVIRFRPRLAVRFFDKTEPAKAVAVLHDFSEPLMAAVVGGKSKSRRRWKSPHVRKRSPKTLSKRSPAKAKSPKRAR